MFTFLCAPYVPSRGHGGTEEAGIPNTPLENEMSQEGAEAHPSEAGEREAGGELEDGTPASHAHPPGGTRGAQGSLVRKGPLRLLPGGCCGVTPGRRAVLTLGFQGVVTIAAPR